MTDISSAKVLIIATDGFEQSELFEPRKRVLRQWAELIEGLATTPR